MAVSHAAACDDAVVEEAAAHDAAEAAAHDAACSEVAAVAEAAHDAACSDAAAVAEAAARDDLVSCRYGS